MVKNQAANAGDTRHAVSIPSPLGVGKSPKRRKWQHAPGKFHGQRNLVVYSPWDCKESDATEHSILLHCLP